MKIFILCIYFLGVTLTASCRTTSSPSTTKADEDASRKVDLLIIAASTPHSDYVKLVDAGYQVYKIGAAAVPALLASLENPVVSTIAKWDLLSILSDIGTTEAIPPLLKWLCGDDSWGSIIAAAGLAPFYPEAESKVLDAWKTCPDYAKPNIARSLGMMRSDAAGQVFVQALAQTGAEYWNDNITRSTREEMIMALGRIGSNSYSSALHSIISNAKPDSMEPKYAKRSLEIIAAFNQGAKPYERRKRGTFYTTTCTYDHNGHRCYNAETKTWYDAQASIADFSNL